MEEYDEEYTNFDEETEDKTNPQWRTLSPKERKLLMKNVFGNPDWYDESHGSPVFEGGQANPMFEEISEKAGAPVREVKRYYAAWLKSQGFSPAEALRADNRPQPSQQQTSYSAATSPPPIGVPTPQPAVLPTLQPPPSDGGNEMWAMMQFLTQQQSMQMQQQQFQMQMMMEQRRLDQQKEGDTRREAMARDQQFMNQQMAFMRDITKNAGDGDGFFDSEFKGIFKEKVLDSFMNGEKDDGWKDSIKDVLGSDTLKAAVGGLGTALATRGGQQIPAGYDNPDYNPYAQTAMIQQPAAQPQQVVQQAAPPQVVQQAVAQPPQALDGVFFDEEAPQPIVQPEPVAQPPPQFNDDEYKKILFSAFVEAMGPVAQDQQVIVALQQQVDVAVENTLREMPEALPQIKLQAMNEKLLLIRNLRDIGMGMMDLRERTPVGETPSAIVTAAVIGELRKNPEFYKIFAENTYDELMAKIEPFKHTGAVEQDFGYLLQPQVQEVCRPLLVAVTNDAQINGMPSVPTLV